MNPHVKSVYAAILAVTLPSLAEANINLSSLASFAGDVSNDKESMVVHAQKIITYREIEKYGYQSIPEALSSVPGFITFHSNGNSGNVVYRGYSDNFPRRTDFYIDGVKMNIAATGGVSWEVFPVDIHDVERIVVYQGVASRDFAGSLFDGAVFIETKDYHDLDAVSFSATNKGDLGAYVRKAFPFINENEKAYISANAKKGSGQFENEDRYISGRVFGKYQNSLSNGIKFTGFLSYAGMGNQDSDPDSVTEVLMQGKEQRQLTTGVGFEQKLNRSFYKAGVSYINYDGVHEQDFANSIFLDQTTAAALISPYNAALAQQIYTDPSVLGLSFPIPIPLEGNFSTSHQTQKIQIDYAFKHQYSDNLSLLADYRLEYIEENPRHFDHSTDIWQETKQSVGAAIESYLEDENLYLKTGVALEFDELGVALSPTFLATKILSAEQSLSFSAAKGVRFPSNWESSSTAHVYNLKSVSGLNLGGIDVDALIDGYTQGIAYLNDQSDSDVKQEEVLNYRLEHVFKRSGQYLKTSLFYSDYDNLISLYYEPPFESIGPYGGMSQKAFNNDGFVVKGLELDGSVALNDATSIHGSYAWSHVTNKAGNIHDYELSIPENTLNLGVTHKFSDYMINAGMLYYDKINWWPSESDARENKSKIVFNFGAGKCTSYGCFKLDLKNLTLEDETEFYRVQTIQPYAMLTYTYQYY